MNAKPKAAHIEKLDELAPSKAAKIKKSTSPQTGAETAPMPKPKAQFASLMSCNSSGRAGGVYVLLKYSSWVFGWSGITVSFFA